MSKDDKSGFDRKSRTELLQVIDEHEKKLHNYESRLRDLVRAYKGQTKEKEALEKTLSALEDGSGEENVTTLTSSLTTVMAEKSRLESLFQEDKRRRKAEVAEARKQIFDLNSELNRLKSARDAEMEELKAQLILAKHDRERDGSDHAIMLRELQRRLVDERNQKEKLQDDLESREKKEKDYEAKIEDLNRELEMKHGDKTSAEELNRLKREMETMKRHHERELERAERTGLEDQVASLGIREQQEARVMSLESRLQELSETIASYDRERQKDQESIVKLRERVAQLDSENFALTKVRKLTEDDEKEEEDDVLIITEKIKRLQAKLIKKQKHFGKEELQNADNYFDSSRFDEKNIEISKWKEEYFKLKSEFDSFKVTHTVNDNNDGHNSFSFKKLNKDMDMDREENLELRSQVADYKQRTGVLRNQLRICENSKNELENEILGLKEEMNELKALSKRSLEIKESETKTQISVLETELEKQRERFLTLSSEKDEELDKLKDTLNLALDRGFLGSVSDQNCSLDMDRLTEKLHPQNDDNKMVLYYLEESSRKDVEIDNLRTKIRDLESTMRELQTRFITKEENYVVEIEDLNDKMSTLRRMSKSDFNLEYLKNVILNYMLSTDNASRHHMLKAIGAVLVFSDKEIRKVKELNNSWFWHKKS